MATIFSNLITDSADNTTLVTGYKADVGVSHGRGRISVGRVKYLALTTYVLRMIKVKSSDRLHTLELTCDGASAAGAVDIGLYLTGAAHDGAVADANLFATAITVSSALDLTEAFVEASTLGGVDRGRTMWEIATLGGGTNYTVDPNLNFDIVIIPSTSLTTTASELTLKATYTAGD